MLRKNPYKVINIYNECQKITILIIFFKLFQIQALTLCNEILNHVYILNRCDDIADNVFLYCNIPQNRPPHNSPLVEVGLLDRHCKQEHHLSLLLVDRWEGSLVGRRVIHKMDSIPLPPSVEQRLLILAPCKLDIQACDKWCCHSHKNIYGIQLTTLPLTIPIDGSSKIISMIEK